MDKKGSGFIPISLKYLRHRLQARYRNGYGVHSPFIYDLVRNVIFNKNRWQVPEHLEDYYKELRRNATTLVIHDLGAGSRVHGSGNNETRNGEHATGSGNNETRNGEYETDKLKNETKPQERKVSAIAQHASVTPRQGALLFRLAKWYRPAAVIEAGTGIGISTSYLAAGAENAGITTIEGSPAKYNFAREHTDVAGSGGLEFLLGTFDTYFDGLTEKAPNRTLFFIDGDHRYLPTLRRVRSVLAGNERTETMIILDDIYWSDGMEQAWQEACAEPGVDISIDLFHMGILIRRPGIPRQHFRISF